MRSLLRGTMVVALAGAVVMVAYTAGRVARHFVAPPSVAWADEAQAPQIQATAQKAAEGGVEKGQVFLNGTLMFTLQVEAGGLSAYERSMIAANRLNVAFVGAAKPEDFVAQVIQGSNCVVAGEQLIVTIEDGDAAGSGKDKAQVAEDWAAAIRSRIREVLGLPQPSPPAAGTGTSTTPPPTPAEVPLEESGQKIVPIVSVGQGLQIGVAQVKGPKTKVDQVQAVAELEGSFKGVLTLEMYVPISTKVPGSSLARVQGVGVFAVAAYKATGG
jgi:hypothetical protein